MARLDVLSSRLSLLFFTTMLLLGIYVPVSVDAFTVPIAPIRLLTKSSHVEFGSRRSSWLSSLKPPGEDVKQDTAIDATYAKNNDDEKEEKKYEDESQMSKELFFDDFQQDLQNGVDQVSQSVAEIVGLEEVSPEDQEKLMGIWAARGLLLVVAMLWGTNFAAVKYLETLCFHPPCNHPPSEAAFARFGVAALVSLPLLIGQKKEIILAGFECGLWITMGYITQAMALQEIDSGKCAFICSLTVVVVPLISALFGKPIKPVNVVSALVALTGVGVLEGLIDVSAITGAISDTAASTTDMAQTVSTSVAGSATTSAMTLASTSNSNGGNVGAISSLANMLGVTKGDLLALGQPLGFGFSFMRIEHYVEKFQNEKNRVLTIAAAECVIVGFCSLLWVLYDFHGNIPNFGYMIEWHRLTAIAWTGIMTTVVAIYLEGFALQVATASDAALTFASEPVWASLFGAWLLREELGPTSYAGGAIILLACVLGAIADLPAFEPKEEAS